MKFEVSINRQFRQPLIDLQMSDNAAGMHVAVMLTKNEVKALAEALAAARVELGEAKMPTQAVRA